MSPELFEAMKAACCEISIEYRNDIPLNDRFTPSPVTGKNPRNGSGRIQLFSDGSGGIAWNHVTQENKVFFAKSYQAATPEERQAQQKRRQLAQEQHRQELEKIHAECRVLAQQIWISSSDAPNDHNYLVKKGIKSHGLKVSKGKLVVPVMDDSLKIHGLQFISDDGTKKFLPGTSVKGHFAFVVGNKTLLYYICEGYATAASVHEATGATVFIAFSCGNLEPTAMAVRVRLPDKQIVIVADNDAKPGVSND